MGLTNFPGGVGSFGMAVLPGASRPYTGRAFFVSNATNANGSNNNSGLRPDQPFQTLAYAVTQVTANNDDVIFVLEGHAENIVAAGTVTCSIAGFSIVGLGNGRARPVFTWSTLTTATWLVSAANVSIQNLVFVGTGIDAVVTMFGITGDDCTFSGCEFDCAITSFVALLGMTITGVQRFSFYNNHVHGAAAANMTNFMQIVGVAGKQIGFRIQGNIFTGNYTTSLGAINNITVAMVDAIITDNYIVNRTASATKGIVLLTGSTGMIMRNTFGQGSGNAPITADAVHRAGNYNVAAVSTDGSSVI